FICSPDLLLWPICTRRNVHIHPRSVCLLPNACSAPWFGSHTLTHTHSHTHTHTHTHTHIHTHTPPPPLHPFFHTPPRGRRKSSVGGILTPLKPFVPHTKTMQTLSAADRQRPSGDEQHS